MSKQIKKINAAAVDRVIDANYNRAKEGLRVCEDVARFVLDDRKLTAGYKNVRHSLTKVAAGFAWKELLESRDVAHDIGRPTTDSESMRANISDILYANTQRVKESLRVLEEFAKLKQSTMAEQIKSLRYRVYGLEKEAFKRV